MTTRRNSKGLSLQFFACTFSLASMSALNSRSSSVPVRSFGTLDSTNLEGGIGNRETSTVRRFLGRISLGNLRGGRQSFGSFRRDGEAAPPIPKSDRPPIPTMMQPSGEAYSTPLPKLSMVVLSIVSNVQLRLKCSQTNCHLFSVIRPCLGNFYLRMCRLHSCYSWSEVCLSHLPRKIPIDVNFH